MSKNRFFSRKQKVALFLAARGKCRECGDPLEAGWHADHRLAWSKGGATEVQNGQALCVGCNLKKSDNETPGTIKFAESDGS